MQFYVYYSTRLVFPFSAFGKQQHEITIELDRATDPEAVDSAILRKVERRLAWWQVLEGYKYELIEG